MSEIGSFEAKTKLPALLKRVENGERITITRRGVPVAELIPVAKPVDRQAVRKAIEDLRRFSKGRSLRGTTIRELIEEGRR
jgi:prevent-host-death family protein